MAIGSMKKAAPATRNSSAKVAPVKAAPAVKKGAFGRPVDPDAPAKASVKRTASKRPARKKFIFKNKCKELKPMFIEVGFSTAADGLLSSAAGSVYLEVIKGSLTNENAPRYDLLQIDPVTSVAIITRLMYRTFSTRLDKRLKANTDYAVVLRLSVGREDRSVKARVKDVFRDNGKTLAQVVDTKDVDRRKLRMCGQFLGGAFTSIMDVNTLKALQADLDARDLAEEETDEE